MMPDLPNVGWERDLESFAQFFEDPAFRADGLKVCTCLRARARRAPHTTATSPPPTTAPPRNTPTPPHTPRHPPTPPRPPPPPPPPPHTHNTRPKKFKVYPTLVIRGTGLYELWKAGLYRNYAPDKLVDLVAR